MRKPKLKERFSKITQLSVGSKTRTTVDGREAGKGRRGSRPPSISRVKAGMLHNSRGQSSYCIRWALWNLCVACYGDGEQGRKGRCPDSPANQFGGAYHLGAPAPELRCLAPKHSPRPLLWGARDRFRMLFPHSVGLSLLNCLKKKKLQAANPAWQHRGIFPRDRPKADSHLKTCPKWSCPSEQIPQACKTSLPTASRRRGLPGGGRPGPRLDEHRAAGPRRSQSERRGSALLAWLSRGPKGRRRQGAVTACFLSWGRGWTGWEAWAVCLGR